MKSIIAEPGRYFMLTAKSILNVVNLVKCLNEDQSSFTKWTEEDGRPDRIGDYRMVTKLRIDPKAAAGNRLFRVRGWEIALIVNDRVKDCIEGFSESGVTFQEAG